MDFYSLYKVKKKQRCPKTALLFILILYVLFENHPCCTAGARLQTRATISSSPDELSSPLMLKKNMLS